jgi:hypothetical protein
MCFSFQAMTEKCMAEKSLRLHVQIIRALLFVKMLDGVPQHRARHRCGVFIQKAEQSRVILVFGDVCGSRFF